MLHFVNLISCNWIETKKCNRTAYLRHTFRIHYNHIHVYIYNKNILVSKYWKHLVEITKSYHFFCFKYRQLPRTASIFRRMHTKCMQVITFERSVAAKCCIPCVYVKDGHMEKQDNLERIQSTLIYILHHGI